MSVPVCVGCGGSDTTYQMFSAGQEYYCPDCDDIFPYESGQAPPRVRMIAEGRFEELRDAMREHLSGLACALSDESGALCKTVGTHDTHDYDLT